MSTPPKDQTIIIKKGGHGHHGHHGGAWKVAYADFVTAMMAFFLVMWIVGQSKATKAAVASYFRDPGAFTQDGSAGVLPGAESGMTGGGQPRAKTATQQLEEAAEHLRQALAKMPRFAELKDQIDIVVTDEGLRIELREAPNGGFFDSGSAQLKPDTQAILQIIAEELGKLDNRVVVEGHTDRAPFAMHRAYTNWELSTDRANAARRVLEESGLRAGQMETVRGFADTNLRVKDDPFNPGNRRVSIVVRRTAAASESAPAGG